MKTSDTLESLIIKNKNIYGETVKRLYEQEKVKYKKEKEVAKAVQKELHLLDGLFNFTRSKLMPQEVDVILNTHLSTKERMSFYAELYTDIINVCGVPAFVADYASGINPVLFAKYCKENNIELKNYYASDISLSALQTCETYFKANNLCITAEPGDLCISVPNHKPDIVFLFKIAPILSRRKKDGFSNVMAQIKAKHVVVTFPLGTVSGRKINMEETYTRMMEEFLTGSKEWKQAFKKSYENEMLYILTKK